MILALDCDLGTAGVERENTDISEDCLSVASSAASDFSCNVGSPEDCGLGV